MRTLFVGIAALLISCGPLMTPYGIRANNSGHDRFELPFNYQFVIKTIVERGDYTQYAIGSTLYPDLKKGTAYITPSIPFLLIDVTGTEENTTIVDYYYEGRVYEGSWIEIKELFDDPEVIQEALGYSPPATQLK